MAMFGLGSPTGTAAPVLYAKSNGGKQLRTASAILSTDAQGFFLDPDTGERIRVATWVSEGDTVGVPAIYNGPTGPTVGSIVGLPMTQQRAGFDAFSVSDYGIVFFSTTELSFIAHHTRGSSPTSFERLIDSDTTDPRFLVSDNGTPTALFVRVVDGSITDATVNGAFANLVEGYAAGAASGSGGNVDAYAYDAGGALIDSDAQTRTPFNVAGLHQLGAGAGGAKPWSGVVHRAMGWDGSYLSGADVLARVSAMEAGTDIDTLRTTYSAQLATDGGTTSLVPSNPNLLIYETGSGASVTAEFA